MDEAKVNLFGKVLAASGNAMRAFLDATFDGARAHLRNHRSLVVGLDADVAKKFARTSHVQIMGLEREKTRKPLA